MRNLLFPVTRFKIYIFIIFSGIFFSANAQKTFTVNTNSDLPDINPEDGICADKDGNCSLRAAIENANLTVEIDFIHFDIPGEGPHPILLNDDLPIITETIILNARTQPGYSINQSKVIILGDLLKDKIDENNEKVPRVIFYLSGNSSGSQISGFTIGGIESTFSIGIYARGTGNHEIFENKIGCTADGSEILGNRGYGMYFQKSHNNIIGSQDREKRNILSGNRMALALDYANNNQILNNFIGTDLSGENFIGNGDGILTWKNSFEEISDGNLSSNNIIKNNVIAGGYRGLMIHGNYNLVEDNFFGTDVTGEIAFPITAGILLSEGSFNEIGGENGNLISGNQGGITIYSSENNVTNNLIGTNRDGKIALPNDYGIILHTKVPEYDARKNVIEYNVISGNNKAAIWIDNSYENQVRNNIIGSSPVPNRNGVEISYSHDNQIIENTVVHNTSKGVIIYGDAFKNKISKNSLYENGEIGIDLGGNGISVNDIEDRDVGPNNLQNSPELISNTFDGNFLEIEYKISSDPTYSSFPLTIEIFKSDGNRQGKEFLVSFEIAASDLPKGRKQLSATLELVPGNSLKGGDLILATATDLNGNTSEFSNEIVVIKNGECAPVIYYADTDNDGFGDPVNSIEACTKPEGYVSNSEDCDDSNANVGLLSTWYRDYDNDNYGDPLSAQESCLQPAGYVQDNTDCDDTNARVYPGAIDASVDGIDQDCDGSDGPVSTCQGSNTILVSEICSTATNIYWDITNPSSCEVTGRWELRKTSFTGASTGNFTIAGGESIEVVSGVLDKGRTQIVVLWNDSNSNELSTTSNASGLECSLTMSGFSDDTNLIVSPNPVTEEGIGMYFTAPAMDTTLYATIYNSSGKLMASQSFSIQAGTSNLLWPLDHTSWIEGVYILNVTVGDAVYQEQFIK